jgi:hypothetical protein
MTVKHLMLAILALAVAIACGGQSTAATPTPAVDFSMVAQNGSTVKGTGQVVQSAGSFTITLKLTGMVPGSSHVSHVHDGQCAATGSIVPAGYAIPISGWYVNVHHGPDFTEAEYAPSDSCGNLTAR